MGWSWKKVTKDIGTVVEKAATAWATQQAIAAVGALLFDTAAEGEEGFTNDTLVKLHDDYEKASNVLEQKAQIVDPPSANFIRPDVKGLMSRAKRLTAVWMDPIAVIDKAPQTYDMYRDLSIFLSLSGVPSTLEISPGHMEDTAAMISQAIFANAPLSFSALAGVTDPVSVIPFTVANHIKDCIIQVKHAYYDIPINARSPTGAWHSSINLQMTTNGRGCRGQKAEKLE
ncbi:unnamed protein product [Penicillium pancosmium]